ncbi:phosphate acetyltransferase [Candidatus Woesearchaeota archaeon]|nr:phosphate acetyltransferase [Candidatus Woesearchaeota archaeon]
MDIIAELKEKAQKNPKRLLFVEGDDMRVVKAAALCAAAKVCKPVVLAKKESQEDAKKEGIALEGIDFIDYITSDKLDDYVAKLVELRKHKGMTEEKARELLKNPAYFGAMMLKLKEVDGAAGGNSMSTAEWMRPVFQVVGPKKGVKTVSAVCFIPMKEKVVFFGDTDFIIDPNVEQLAQIAINAADFAKGIGIEPKVALLSYSTKGSGEHEVLKPIREALALVKKQRPDIIVDGEMQVDAAVNPKAAQKKSPDSPLKGEANVLIFPNITVGNVLIHSLGQWTDYKLYGSFPVGLSRPVANGGRSFSPEQIFESVVPLCAEIAHD